MEGKIPQNRVLPTKEASAFRTLLTLYENKLYKKAVKQADQILRAHPTHGETLAVKGLSMANLELLEKSKTLISTEPLDLIKQGIRNDTTSFVCWQILGLYHRLCRNYSETLKCYRTALKIEPNNNAILRDSALLQVHERQYSNLIDTRTVLLQSDSSAATWRALSLAYALGNQFLPALQALDSSLEFPLETVSPISSGSISELARYRWWLEAKTSKPLSVNLIIDQEAMDEAILSYGTDPSLREVARSRLLQRNPDRFVFESESPILTFDNFLLAKAPLSFFYEFPELEFIDGPDDLGPGKKISLALSMDQRTEYTEAVKVISECISQLELLDHNDEPTLQLLGDSLLVRSKINKHLNQLRSAAEDANRLALLFPKDRIHNSRAVRRLLQLNAIDQAREIFSKFTTSMASDLKELQIAWYFIRKGEAHWRLGDYVSAVDDWIWVVDQFLFKSLTDDVFDFHQYAPRRLAFLNYIDLLSCTPPVSNPTFYRHPIWQRTACNLLYGLIWESKNRSVTPIFNEEQRIILSRTIKLLFEIEPRNQYSKLAIRRRILLSLYNNEGLGHLLGSLVKTNSMPLKLIPKLTSIYNKHQNNEELLPFLFPPLF